MKYYALSYPNHTTLVLKTTDTVEMVCSTLFCNIGIRHTSGSIFNPQTYLTLNEILNPDERQKLAAQELSKVLIG